MLRDNSFFSLSLSQDAKWCNLYLRQTSLRQTLWKWQCFTFLRITMWSDNAASFSALRNKMNVHSTLVCCLPTVNTMHRSRTTHTPPPPSPTMQGRNVFLVCSTSMLRMTNPIDCCSIHHIHACSSLHQKLMNEKSFLRQLLALPVYGRCLWMPIDIFDLGVCQIHITFRSYCNVPIQMKIAKLGIAIELRGITRHNLCVSHRIIPTIPVWVLTL